MKTILALLATLIVTTSVHALPDAASVQRSANALAGKTPADFGRVSLLAAALAKELSAACPLADPASEAALKRCKDALYGPSLARRALPAFVLWGRMRDPNLLLKNTTLTQFGPDVFTATYWPLFMFNGEYQVRFDERENLHRIDFVAAFRNRMAPGQYPYPFWHEENKWAVYEGANRMTLWVAVDDTTGTEKIKAMQFSTFGDNHAGMPAKIGPRPFTKEEEKWLWTDANGKTQPAVTLFDNLYSPDNPHLKKLDGAYRDVALEMRNAQCLNCHVPNNPDKMKRLVLLQTPAHAASEIGRLIKSVREDRMPLDEVGIEKPMPANMKDAVLAKALAFQAALTEAQAWEAQRKTK